MTRPKFPVPVWFQPVSTLQAMRDDLGVNCVFGPEVENSKALAADVLANKQAAWIAQCAALGLGVILTTPVSPVPANCLGWFIPVDEPNGHSPLITATQLKPYVDKFRAIDKTLPIFIDLAGSKISSANWSKNKDGSYQRPAEIQLFLDYASLDPHIIFTVDAYSMNLNASRYPFTWTADIVAKMMTALRENNLKREVWFWVEANDQQLSAPPVGSMTDGVHQDINREPTPAEIEGTWKSAIAQGATGGGPFLTCDTGKYGWPGSYYPQINRNKVSMAQQYAKLKALSTQANAAVTVTPPPVVAPPVVVPPVVVPPVQPVEQGPTMADLQAAMDKRMTALEAWAKGIGYKSV